jgi:hypothetical protein
LDNPQSLDHLHDVNEPLLSEMDIDGLQRLLPRVGIPMDRNDLSLHGVLEKQLIIFG